MGWAFGPPNKAGLASVILPNVTFGIPMAKPVPAMERVPIKFLRSNFSFMAIVLGK